MRLNEVVYTDALPIDGYGDGFFRVGGEVRPAPLAILPTGVTEWTGYDDTAALLDAASRIDVLLVGTGPDVAHIPSAFRGPLEEAGIGVEIMSSPQAARTYNVLLGEGRRVGVALMPATEKTG